MTHFTKKNLHLILITVVGLLVVNYVILLYIRDSLFARINILEASLNEHEVLIGTKADENEMNQKILLMEANLDAWNNAQNSIPITTGQASGTSNMEKLSLINEQILKIKIAIDETSKFLEVNPYNQDAQARKRDLEYQLRQHELERIRYQ